MDAFVVGLLYLVMVMTAALLLAALLQSEPVVPDTGDSTTADETAYEASSYEAAVGTPSFEAALEALQEADEDVASVYEALQDAARWRIPINTASDQSLRSLPGLSERDLRRILTHRVASGPFAGPEDLLAAGLSAETAAALAPFVTFSEQRPPSRLPLRIDLVQRMNRRLDVGRGYGDGASSRYAGSPLAVQSRLRIRLGHRLSAGVTLDKDAGEPLSWSPGQNRYGPDFASVHAALDQVGALERLAVGGYAVQAGEGLVLGHGTSGMAALRVASVDRLLRPHTSAREHGYFRGLALQTRTFHGASLAAFVSSQALDGRTDTLQGTWRLAAPGHHRTRTELGGRRLIRSRVAGGLTSLRRDPLHLGVLFVYTQYGLADTFREVSSVSVFGGWIQPRWALTAETVPDRALHSVTAAFSPIVDGVLIIRVRRTAPGAPRPHTSIGVDGRGDSFDMREWEAECSFQPLGAWTVTGRVRERQKAGASLPFRTSRHGDILLVYRPRHWFTFQMRATSRSSDEPASCSTGGLQLRCLGVHARRSLRFQVEYHHSDALRARSRVEMVRAQVNGQPGEVAGGFLIYEDLRWRPGRLLQIDARYALFETSDAAARVYAFEHDVLYAFSAPSFSGRGRRWYVLARVEPAARFTVQVKIGATLYEDVVSVGSGLDEVSGNRIREMKLQIRWRVGH